jgi:hypothetical protein
MTLKENKMDIYIEEIISIIEKSIEKNGDKPLTLSHLKNILKKADKNIENNEKYLDDIESYYSSLE